MLEGVIFCQEQSMKSLEIGVSTAAFYPKRLTEQALDTAAKLGFSIAEVFLQCRTEYALSFGKALNRRRKANGVRVHSLHLHTHFFELWSPYSRMRNEAQDNFRRVLDIANLLEAKALTWHGIRSVFTKNAALQTAFLDSVAWAAEQAHKANITLCIENVSWCYLRTIEQVQALNALDVPVGFTFDTFQAGESEVNATTLLETMGRTLKTVHLSDYAPDRPRHLPLGEGNLDWTSTLQTLIKIGYSGPLIIELAHVKTWETLLESKAFIEDLL